VLLSLHLKATMMKISDPIMFGHAVSVYYKDVFDKHGAGIERAGGESEQRPGRSVREIKKLPEGKRAEIEADIQAVYKDRPALAMVDSDKGITNLHVRATSSSTRRCRSSCATRGRCGARMESCTTRRDDSRPVLRDDVSDHH